ncbi:MAG: spore coat associated protein CotJA [Lachnospiraceae bacterium]
MGNCNKNCMGRRECEERYDMASNPEYALAMAYVPWQYFEHVYEPDRALEVGTIFPELNKPFYGRKGMRGC